MKKSIKTALAGIKNVTTAFLKKRGIYVVAFAVTAAVGASAWFAAQSGEPVQPQSTADAGQVNANLGDKLGSVVAAKPTPAATPAAPATPLPDITPAPQTPKPGAVQKLSPPVRGEVIWGYAVNELIYSRTLDQWTTHTGVDIAAPKGSDVYSVFTGTVSGIFEDDSLGVMVEICGKNGMTAVYGNLKADPPVKEGARVNAGDIIGFVGDTALSECGDKSHVHFELLKDDKYVDPQQYVLFIKDAAQ